MVKMPGWMSELIGDKKIEKKASEEKKEPGTGGLFTKDFLKQYEPKVKQGSAFGEMAMEKQMNEPVEVSKMEDVMEGGKEKKPSNPMLNSKTIEGMDSVERSYSGFLVPVARYALTAVLKEKNPQILSNGNLAQKATSTDIEIDVGKVEAAADGVNAIYNDMVITALTHYGDYIIKCYAKERKQAQDWIASLEERMLKQNQYRGKCLHVENGQVIFRKVSSTMWDDVILDEKVKKDIRMNTVAFLGDEKMAKVNVGKRGLIMYGPPGTGKSSACKAVFNELEQCGKFKVGQNISYEGKKGIVTNITEDAIEVDWIDG